MSERNGELDLPVWKILLTLIAFVLWGLQWLAVDKGVMESISGASSDDLNYWGTKAAGFALIAAVAVVATLIPAKSRLVNFLPGLIGVLAALFSGYYWLEEATNGNAGGYIFVVLVAGLFMSFSVMIGPAISLWRERRSGEPDS